MIHLATIVPHGNMVLKAAGWVSADKSAPERCTDVDPAADCMNPENLIHVNIASADHIFYNLKYG